LLLIAVALGLRVAVVLVLRTDHAAPLTYEHGRIAENLLAGRGFSIGFLGGSGPTSQQAPFYPLLLAAVYGCAGGPSAATLLAVQLIQAVAGTGLVLAVAWLGWALFPSRREVGWIAAWGAAVFPAHLYMVTHFQVALWAALGLTVLLALVSDRRWQGSWSGAAVAGGLSGAILLIEPILALALPVAAGAFWFGGHGRTWAQRFGLRPLGQIALMAVVAAAVIAPWTIRNRLVHGRWIFVKSTFGYAFWQGNNPVSRGTDKIPKPSAEVLRRRHDGTLAGIDKALWEARHETVYIDDLVLKPTGYRGLEGLDEPDRCAALGARAETFVRAQPHRYAALCLKRMAYFLTFDGTNPKAAHPLYRATTIAWLLLAGLGLFAARRHGPRLWPSVAIFLLIAAFHSLTIVSARFRIPLEPMTMTWAAWAVMPLLARFGRPADEAPESGPPAGANEQPGRQSGGTSADGSRSAPAAFGPEHALRGPHFPKARKPARG
jgi:hypothetical protein